MCVTLKELRYTGKWRRGTSPLRSLRDGREPLRSSGSKVPYDRSIDVHVSKLRKKLVLELPGMERIKAIRGKEAINFMTKGTP